MPDFKPFANYLVICLHSLLLVCDIFAAPFFIDITSETPLGDRGAGVGVASGDYDNNGWIDIVVTNRDRGDNKLFLNYEGTFVDATSISGLEPPRHTLGCSVADIDNDSYLDLVVVNYADDIPGIYLNGKQSTYLFNNINSDGELRFGGNGTCAHLWDINNDGFIDILYGANKEDWSLLQPKPF